MDFKFKRFTTSGDRLRGRVLGITARKSGISLGENHCFEESRFSGDGSDFAVLSSFSKNGKATTGLPDGTGITRSMDNLGQAVEQIQFPFVKGGTATGAVLVRTREVVES